MDSGSGTRVYRIFGFPSFVSGGGRARLSICWPVVDNGYRSDFRFHGPFLCLGAVSQNSPLECVLHCDVAMWKLLLQSLCRRNRKYEIFIEALKAGMDAGPLE
jgi:hypothetical protein